MSSRDTDVLVGEELEAYSLPAHVSADQFRHKSIQDELTRLANRMNWQLKLSVVMLMLTVLDNPTLQKLGAMLGFLR